MITLRISRRQDALVQNMWSMVSRPFIEQMVALAKTFELDQATREDLECLARTVGL